MACVGLLLLLLLVAAAVPAAASGRAAVIYSAWMNDRHQHEWDPILTGMGYAVDAYANTALSDLTTRLSDYDLVLTTTCCNYVNPVDFSPFAAPFMAYLQQGGLVIFTDGNYPTTINQGLAKLSPALACSFEQGPIMRSQAPEAAKLHPATDASLARIPNDLLPLMEKAGHWAHLLPQAPGWVPVVLDADDKPTLIYQPVGQGLVVAHNYFGFKRSNVTPLGRPLLENVLLLHQALRAGIEVVALDWGEMLPGQNRARIAVRSRSDQPVALRLQWALTADEQPQGTLTMDVTAPPGEARAIEWPYQIKQRGLNTLTLRALKDAEPALELSRQAEVPETLTLFAWRRHARLGDPTFKLEAALNPNRPFDAAAHRLVLRAAIGDAQTRPLSLKPETAEIALPLKGLPLGKGTITARLMRGAQEIAAAEWPLEILPQPYVAIRPDGATTVAGKPFFPVGCYIVPYKLENKDHIYDMMGEIAAGGFNVVYTAADSDAAFERMLSEAERLGVMMMFGGGSKPEWRQRHSDSRPILSWCTIDEPDGGAVLTPAQVAEMSSKILDQDPNRPTYVTLCAPPSYAEFCRTGDIIAPDPYPVGKVWGIDYVARCLESLQGSLQGNRPVWGVPQAFGGYGSYGIPSPAQERNMTYQFLVHGAKGLIYYAYYDGGFDMRQHPDLWAMMSRLAKEVQALAPVLLDPSPGQILRAGPQQQVHALWKRHAGTDYLIAVNASEEDLGEVEFGLPGVRNATLQGLFGEPEATVRQGKLRLPMPPLAVQVLKLTP